MKLHPLRDCVANASQLAAAGVECYQKFICSHCKSIQTMEHPNLWHKLGRCEECNHVTNIEADGCNYLVVASTPEAQEALWKNLIHD